jgi:hypothetical protein
MSEEEKPKLGWGGRREGSGRRRGSVDARPREIREAMLLGAATSDLGRDEEHPEGDLVVFFRTLCNKELPLFVGLLNRLIPKQINQQTESTIGLNVVFETVDQVAAELERSGMTHQQVKQIQAMLPMPVINENGKSLDEEEPHDGDILFDRNDHD